MKHLTEWPPWAMGLILAMAIVACGDTYNGDCNDLDAGASCSSDDKAGDEANDSSTETADSHDTDDHSTDDHSDSSVATNEFAG